MDIKKGAVITASHQKGGVGKTTVIWNLLIEFSKERPVSIIDMDMQENITHCLAIRKSIKDNNSTNIEQLEAPTTQKELINLLYNKCEKEGRLVFIDLGGYDSDFNRMIMAASNVIITPVSTKFLELLGARTYETLLKQISKEWRNDNKLISSIILNKINPLAKTKSNTLKTKLENTLEYMENSDYFSLFKTILRQRIEYEESPEVGKSVVEYKPYSMAAKEVLSLKKEIKELI